MADRIAIKKMTASDCTLFEAVFRKIGAGNQKSINLNADILTGQFYPNLAAIASETNNEVPLPISIFGPAGKGLHKLTRKIIKNPTYKNWRLNGEFISGPLGDVTRYDEMKPGDLAVMIFKGVAAPSQMELILVSQDDPTDASLHGALGALFANKSMIAVGADQIAMAAATASIPDSHPIYISASDPEMDSALEDAAQGGISGTAKLLTNKSSKRVSAADLAKAKLKAEQTGQDGEGLVNAYLAAKLASKTIFGYSWISLVNAVSPYDFEILTAANQRELIDAKTTTGPFENVIHLSLSEVIEAAGDVPYRLYRIYEINENGGKLRISEDIREIATSIKAIHEAHMPNGIRVDGFSFAIATFKWGAEEYIERPDDDAP